MKFESKWWACWLYILALVVFLLVLFGCSLDRFSEFSIVSSSLSSNGIIGTEKEPITLTFTKEIAKPGASSYISIEDDNGSSIGIKCTVDEKAMIILPDEEWKPYTRYWLIIDRGLTDVYGRSLDNNYYIPFQSTDVLLPVSAIIISPEVKNNKIEEEINVFEILFSSPVDKESIERAFSIVPDLDGYFEWIEPEDLSEKEDLISLGYTGDKLIFTPLEPIIPNNVYSVIISEDGLDKSGFHIERFERSFEYKPNTPFPAVDRILVDNEVIFDLSALNQNSGNQSCSQCENIRIENKTFIITYDRAEKSCEVQFEFSEPIDPVSFKEKLSISPSAEFELQWYGQSLAGIRLQENLEIQKYYSIELKNGVESNESILMQYGYLIEIFTGGDFSTFLSFYADDFTTLQINGELFDDDLPVVIDSVQTGKDDEGYFIRIIYTDPAENIDPSSLEAKVDIELLFENPIYVPEIDRATVQDGTTLNFVMGQDPISRDKTGIIQGFNWLASNRCVLNLSGLGNNNIYSFSIMGGESGVIDSHENYMKDDVLYYFKLIIEES